MNFIGQSAPQWTRKGSNSDQESTFSSQMLLGKWYVVYWYPKDFSSVCPTEVRAIEQYFESFSDEEVAIFGCSFFFGFPHKTQQQKVALSAPDLTSSFALTLLVMCWSLCLCFIPRNIVGLVLWITRRRHIRWVQPYGCMNTKWCCGVRTY